MLVKQTQTEVMQEAALTTCSNMFKKFVVDTSSARIDCEQRTSDTSFCQAQCLGKSNVWHLYEIAYIKSNNNFSDPTHRLSFGSPETVICKKRKAQPGGAKVKKASFRCAPLDTEQASK